MHQFYRRGFQAQVCRSVTAWCRQSRRQIGALRRKLVPGGGVDAQLASWQTTLSELESEAAALLRAVMAGLYDPQAIAALFNRAIGAFTELASLLRSDEGEPTRTRQIRLPEPRELKEAVILMEAGGRVPIGGHRLPPLPYPYDALEPHIDAETMRLHHLKHHQSYVDGLNRAEEEMAEARRTGNFDLIRHWEREAAFNGAGHYLHTIFWKVMNPVGGGEPTGDLAAQITRDFGGVAPFRQHFSHAAEKVEAVGWAILVWAPRAHRLEILQAEKHQNLSQWDLIPVLPLDVWEHAYYLQYKNERKRYIEAWWNLVDWSEVSRRFDVARQVKWEPF